MSIPLAACRYVDIPPIECASTSTDATAILGYRASQSLPLNPFLKPDGDTFYEIRRNCDVVVFDGDEDGWEPVFSGTASGSALALAEELAHSLESTKPRTSENRRPHGEGSHILFYGDGWKWLCVNCPRKGVEKANADLLEELEAIATERVTPNRVLVQALQIGQAPPSAFEAPWRLTVPLEHVAERQDRGLAVPVADWGIALDLRDDFLDARATDPTLRRDAIVTHTEEGAPHFLFIRERVDLQVPEL